MNLLCNQDRSQYSRKEKERTEKVRRVTRVHRRTSKNRDSLQTVYLEVNSPKLIVLPYENRRIVSSVSIRSILSEKGPSSYFQFSDCDFSTETLP